MLQVAKIFRRKTIKEAGLKEEKTLRTIQALVVSCLTYILPFHCFNKQQMEQANSTLCTAYKAAFGWPNYTVNEKLKSLGISSSFDEIRQALIISQKGPQK